MRAKGRRGGALGRAAGAVGRMREDLEVVLERDPAATSSWEAAMYPHVHALWAHRVAHHLYLQGHRLGPRAISLFARFATGLDIHPGARIGRRLFIDHGHGVVIGETVEIGDDVTLYHQVTLGAVGWWKDVRRPRGEKRHPTLEDGVIVGAGSQILGPITVGAGSKIGAHTLLLESLPPDSVVRGAAATVIRRGRPRTEEAPGIETLSSDPALPAEDGGTPWPGGDQAVAPNGAGAGETAGGTQHETAGGTQDGAAGRAGDGEATSRGRPAAPTAVPSRRGE